MAARSIRSAALKKGLSGYGDIVVAAGMVAIVIMMVVPIPWQVMDLLLALNLTLSLSILMVSMYTKEPLEFSAFPSMLLMATLFRLALNVSSTRLILLKGFAGNLIQTFGEFVVGGQAVVGLVVFLILVVIQFVVITRGAERVAEVAARFTLDAMPGKQMSIDADLNAGAITEEEARARRSHVQREADFYGAMDGASKFVKGDAIAGLLITFINLLGGFLIGIIGGLGAGEAWNKYALLTVGDGLAAQIPALLISTATGITVTRAASEANLGADLVTQITREPRVLGIVGGTIMILGVLPGMPRLAFFALGGLTVWASTALRKAAEFRRLSQEEVKEVPGDASRVPENVISLIPVDPIEVEVGYGLITLADSSRGGDLLDRISMIRRQMALELGIVVPPIRVRDNLGQLGKNEYSIKLRGIEVGRGEVIPDRLLAIGPDSGGESLEGIETTEPTFGLPAKWIVENTRESAEIKGCTVVDPTTVMATHLSEVLKKAAHRILTRQDVRELLDVVKNTHPALLEEITPGLLSLGEIQKVLQNLLKEGISIRDMVTILEALADVAPSSRDPITLTEYARRALSGTIMKTYDLDKGNALVVSLDPQLEVTLAEAIGDDSRWKPLDPATTKKIYESVSNEISKLAERGRNPVVVCSGRVRAYFRALVERAFPNLGVVAYEELDPGTKIESVGIVSIQ